MPIIYSISLSFFFLLLPNYLKALSTKVTSAFLSIFLTVISLQMTCFYHSTQSEVTTASLIEAVSCGAQTSGHQMSGSAVGNLHILLDFPNLLPYFLPKIRTRTISILVSLRIGPEA